DDLSGYKKYFATGGFQWKKQPVNYYVDKFSIGFPSHMGVLFPSSGGNITQHAHQYYLYNTSTGAKTYYTKKTRPVDFDPALGVSGTYDLVSSGSIQSNLRHGGSMSQYFYVRNTKVGERFNVKFQYGHARSVLNIGVSYPSSGISLNANTVNDVIHKVVE